jgi:YVTN family beta-propeller protein
MKSGMLIATLVLLLLLNVGTVFAQTVVATVAVGSEPAGVAFDSRNGDVYVTNLCSDTVSVIDGATNTVVATVT